MVFGEVGDGWRGRGDTEFGEDEKGPVGRGFVLGRGRGGRRARGEVRRDRTSSDEADLTQPAAARDNMDAVEVSNTKSHVIDASKEDELRLIDTLHLRDAGGARLGVSRAEVLHQLAADGPELGARVLVRLVRRAQQIRRVEEHSFLDARQTELLEGLAAWTQDKYRSARIERRGRRKITHDETETGRRPG